MYFGIYGFNFSKEIRCDELGLTLIPSKRLTSQDRTKKAEDRKKYYLTGIIKMDSINQEIDEKIWMMSNILTFCQQQAVIVTYDHRETEESFPDYLDYQMGRYERQGGGNVLCIDDKSRENLINLLCNKLQDKSFLSNTSFDKAFHYNVARWNLREQYVEIIYYLSFSALETLARKNQRYTKTKNVIKNAIEPFLISLGFCVCSKVETTCCNHKLNKNTKPAYCLNQCRKISNKQEFFCSSSCESVCELEKFKQIRDKLFHNSEGYESNENFFEYAHLLDKLLPYVILKVSGFTDNYINWNGWKDLTAFHLHTL